MNKKQKTIITSIIISILTIICSIIILTFFNIQLESAKADSNNILYAGYFNPNPTSKTPYHTPTTSEVGTNTYYFTNAAIKVFISDYPASLTQYLGENFYFTTNFFIYQVSRAGTNYDFSYKIYNGDADSHTFELQFYFKNDSFGRGAVTTLRYKNPQSGSWYNLSIQNSETNYLNKYQIAFIGSDTAITGGGNYGTYCYQEIIKFFNQGYYIDTDLTNASSYPMILLPNTTNNIKINPYSGYNYPSTISYTGTASDVQ